MSQELLSIIEQIEREKGIKKEVLIEAVETALCTAARKVIGAKLPDELRVEIDRQTGEIKVYKDQDRVVSMDFGRIAASCARQVIIQKIREAEKEVVFNEFQNRVGEIISGIIYRFDKGNVVVDLLGKAEGIMPRKEQSPREEFKQGQRIRVYVLDVRRDSKAQQIILSRTHPNLVKKFFELEVPEIYEGVVEIKAVAREPGERTKIAVWSKNDKVDSVGACVGMRGNRVRNIVNELQGEKIDIVRFSDDIREYIKAALSPAKIKEIGLDKENLKAMVIVDDDQLSLAIGKHGQNVRLASRLIGWDLDIRSKTPEDAQQKLEPDQADVSKADISLEPADTEIPKDASLKELPGVGAKTMQALIEAGFKSVKNIAKAKVEDLQAVKGIGDKKAQKLIEAAKKAQAK